MQSYPKPKPNFELVDFFSRFIMTPDSCAELRIIDCQHSKRSNWIEQADYGIIAGWYNKPDHLAADIKKINYVSGYITPNPVNSSFLKIKHNSFKKTKKDTLCTHK